MSSNVFLKAGRETIAEAIKLDKQGNYEKAYGKYQEAMDQFMKAIKYEKHDGTKEVLRKKCAEYMNRAEELQKVLKYKKTEVTVDGQEDGGNAEFKRLERALEDAIVRDKPNVKWSDVAGLEPTKVALKEAVILPVKFPQFFSKENPPWKGILLYGPPGTGKSFLAKAVATESDSTFFSVSAADLGSKWQGESEKLVKTLFQMSRLQAPSIVFIDEVDSLCGAREAGQSDTSQKVKTEFLRQMDGIGPKSDDQRLLVLAATNLPWSLDVAMRRRFEKRIYVPLPDQQGRDHLFKLKVGQAKTELTEDDYNNLAKKSSGYSGADVAIAVREALMLPLRDYQAAKFFQEDADGFYLPVMKYPPCPLCPQKVGSAPSSAEQENGERCESCGAVRVSLFDAPSEKFRQPVVKRDHFFQALKGISASVSKGELKKFEKWTEEFGQYGSS